MRNPTRYSIDLTPASTQKWNFLLAYTSGTYTCYKTCEGTTFESASPVSNLTSKRRFRNSVACDVMIAPGNWRLNHV